MTFDTITDRRGTGATKWDMMQTFAGVSPDDGLPMWVADMDFTAPDFLQDALHAELDKANYGYFCNADSYLEAVAWWMKTRHGWSIQPDWMFTTAGLGNAIALAITAFTGPEDHVAIFSPVYHEFAGKIRRCGRGVTELPLAVEDGIYRMDFDRYDALLTGREKMVLISAPHNPAGRVWTAGELGELADFCTRHDLLLVSDEIHQDIVFSGHKHIPMHVAAPQIEDRLITVSAASKTFNIAGLRTGCVTIPDSKLRTQFKNVFDPLNIAPNLFGVVATRAVYSEDGAAWVDQLTAYLEGNAQEFAAGIAKIPGLTSMPMQGTYLAWVDFSGTGMSQEEFASRVTRTARIAPTPGHALGLGGETFLRFNIGTQRARVTEAVARLQDAFSDLQ